MAQSPAPEKSEGTEPPTGDRGGPTFQIAWPPRASKAQYVRPRDAQGVLAAYRFADDSRRDADRE